MKPILLFLLANAVLISVAVVFMIGPAAESLRVVSADVLLMESRDAELRRMGLAYEDNLREMDIIGQQQIAAYGQLPLILAEVSRLAGLRDLQQVSFVALEPVYHDVTYLRFLEVRVRAEYEGLDISYFLHDLSGADVFVSAADVRFEGDEWARLGLEFSIFVAEN